LQSFFISLINFTTTTFVSRTLVSVQKNNEEILIFRLAAALALVLAAGPSARAAAEPLAGVVLDQTVTVAGHEFYEHFCAFWHDKPMNEMFAIAIRERLSARRGNQVVVEYAGRVLFQGALPPARADVRPVSQQAVEISYESVANAEVQRLLFSNDELAPDEL
jgi:curli production assembly/transport component CsgE